MGVSARWPATGSIVEPQRPELDPTACQGSSAAWISINERCKLGHELSRGQISGICDKLTSQGLRPVSSIFEAFLHVFTSPRPT